MGYGQEKVGNHWSKLSNLFLRLIYLTGKIMGTILASSGILHYLTFFSSLAVTIIGGIVFLAFAFSALFISPDSGF